MKFLYLLEKIRNPVFDFFFSLITHIGEETVFLVIAILFFWCINKREGYYILITGLVGTLVNQFLKLVCKVRRPWVKDPSFTIVESAKEQATGYSFPSGHTQNVAGTFGAIGAYCSKKWIRISAIVVIVLVSFSRMYLGVHTPWDVLASLGIAAVLIFGLYPLFKNEERFNKAMPYIVAVSFILSFAFIMYVLYAPGYTFSDVNYKSAMKNAYTLFGCTLGLVAVYTFDRLYINFDTKAPWYAQVIKLALGLCGVIGIKVGLSSPLTALFGNEYTARAARYAFIVIFAGILWPLTFKLFAKMRIKCLDDFAVKVRCIFDKELRASVEAQNEAEKKRTKLENRKKKQKKNKKK